LRREQHQDFPIIILELDMRGQSVRTFGLLIRLIA
jgi:hypothetical protein